MTTEPTSNRWNLPPSPRRGTPVSAAMMDALYDAALKGGWPAVYKVFAEGETITEVDPTGSRPPRERAARDSTLRDFLRNRRSDLEAILDDAAQQRRHRLLSNLEDEVEKIALGPGDVTQDFGKDGRVTRTRVDKRNKLYAALQLLKAHDPDTYAERRKLDVAGSIDHKHTARLDHQAGIRITAEQIGLLPPERAALLLELLTEVQEIEHEEHGRNLGSADRTRAEGMRYPQLECGTGTGEEAGGPSAE